MCWLNWQLPCTVSHWYIVYNGLHIALNGKHHYLRLRLKTPGLMSVSCWYVKAHSYLLNSQFYVRKCLHVISLDGPSSGVLMKFCLNLFLCGCLLQICSRFKLHFRRQGDRSSLDALSFLWPTSAWIHKKAAEASCVQCALLELRYGSK